VVISRSHAPVRGNQKKLATTSTKKMNHLIYNTYLKLFFWFGCSLIISIATFNWLIDPFDVYRIIKIAGLNSEKTQIEITGKIDIKARCLLEGNYNVAILGTSRSNRAINPRHEVFVQMGKAYNTSLAGSRWAETEQVINFIVKNKKNIKTLVISLDFLMFTDFSTDVNVHFEQSLFSQSYSFLNKIQPLFSLDETYYSVKTLMDNYQGIQTEYKNSCQKQGFPDRESVLPHRTMFIQLLTRYFKSPQVYMGYCVRQQDKVENFKNTLKTIRKQNILVKFFISPIHAWQQEMLIIIGVYPMFEQWKRDLTMILAQDAAQHPDKPAYPLWDFTGYNRITTETIPILPRQKMQWYWESSHFKKELGNLVLDKLFNYQSQRTVPTDFGILINSQNIEAHLQKLREQQQRYHQTHPQDIAQIEALAAQTMQKVDSRCP
jgi:hypothetical protein